MIEPDATPTPATPPTRWRHRVCRSRHLGLVVGALVVLLVPLACATDAPTATEDTTVDQRVDDLAGDAAAGDDAGRCLPPTCGTTVPFVPEDGYVGPGPGAPSGPAAVDGASVVTSTSGPWWAQGLVVNGSAVLPGIPDVRAELLDASGGTLATVSAPAFVGPLRPGEPAPFRLTAPTIDAAQVADVSWTVVPNGQPSDGVRSLGLNVFWTRPAGGEAVDVTGYADAGGAGSPMVVYAGVTNTSDAPVRSPGVVAAWVDGRGKVLAVVAAPVLAPGSTDPLDELAPGASADVVLVVGADDAAGLGAVPPLLWGVGRR